MKFHLNVNSRMVELDVDPDLPLLWALRTHLHITDAAYGKVRIDGVLVRSCITPVSTIGSAPVRTIEATTLPPISEAALRDRSGIAVR